MRRRTTAALIALLLYSGWLVALEATRGPAAARFYLDDPPAPALFGHVNTTLSAALLFGCALLFAVGRRVDRAAGRTGDAAFARSQVVVFLFLAIDERFRLTPAATGPFGVPEEFVYAVLASLELALLLGPGRLAERPRRAIPVACAGLLYVASALLDRTGHPWVAGYASEELPKVWAGALLFRFAWRRLEDGLEAWAAEAPGVAFAWARGAAARQRRSDAVAGAAGAGAADAAGAAAAGAAVGAAVGADAVGAVVGRPARPVAEPERAAAPKRAADRAPTARGAHSKSGRP